MIYQALVLRLLLKKAFRLVAVAALPLLSLPIIPTDAGAAEPWYEFEYESPAEGQCFVWWLCDDGSGGWSYTDPSLC